MKALKIIGITLIALFIINIFSPSDKKQNDLNEDNRLLDRPHEAHSNTSSSDHKQPTNLYDATSQPTRPSSRSMTIETMKNNFNTFTSVNDLDFHIADITISEGEVNNTFSYTFNKNIVWIGALHKTDNSIKELTMICAGEGSSGADIMLMMAAMIATVDPSLAPAERGQILKSLRLMNNKQLSDGLETNTVKNGIKYWVNVGGVMGVWFGASLEG